MKIRSFTVSVLAVLFVLAAASLAVAMPEVPSSAFASVDNCGCHSGLAVTWAKSMHAQALTDPIYQHELELANQATDGALGPFCNGCHAPIAVMAGETAGLPEDAGSAVAAEAINCDFCHQITGGTEPRGNSGYLLDSPDGTKRAQFDDAKSAFHATAYSAFHETAEFCGNCHDVYHPINGLPLEQTYTEWKNGPYAAEGIVCQDCHMTPGPGPTTNPGKAAAFGPDRPHIFTMTWAGGNVALGDADLAEERLQAAAEIEIVIPEYVPAGQTGDVEVTITNVGAGHYLPTGLTEFRQMWLEVTATDADGENVMDEAYHFGLELADEAGNHPVPLWEAVSIARDDRIPPKESRSFTYELTMPEGGVADIDATMYYRSVSEEVAEAAHVEVPTTTMVSATTVLYGDADIAADATRDTMRDSAADEGFSLIWIAGLALLAVAGIIFVFARRQKKTA